MTTADTPAPRSGRPLKALVVGAGIGGLTAAVALRSVGVDVEVFERATELKAAGSGLSVMSNALAALRTLDLDLGLEKRGQALRVFDIRTHKGRLIRALPIAESIAAVGAPSICISRSALQQALLDHAGDLPVTLGTTVTGYTAHGDGVRVTFADGRHADGDVLIGADGFHSAVRRTLVGPEEQRDSGYISWLGIVPYTHPRLTTGSVHHYWGRGRRFGLIDIGHGQVYWWGTRNMSADACASWPGGARGKEAVRRSYAGWAGEVRQAIEDTPEDAILGVGSRDRAFLERWGEGPVTLLGDAAHPMLTSLGQGSGIAIEDAVVLAHCLARAADPVAGLRRYEDLRRERARQMVAASRQLSDFEQVESPLRCAARNAYYRWLPRRTLVARNTASLTFPPLEG